MEKRLEQFFAKNEEKKAEIENYKVELETSKLILKTLKEIKNPTENLLKHISQLENQIEYAVKYLAKGFPNKRVEKLDKAFELAKNNIELEKAFVVFAEGVGLIPLEEELEEQKEQE